LTLHKCLMPKGSSLGEGRRWPARVLVRPDASNTNGRARVWRPRQSRGIIGVGDGCSCRWSTRLK